MGWEVKRHGLDSQLSHLLRYDFNLSRPWLPYMIMWNEDDNTTLLELLWELNELIYNSEVQQDLHKLSLGHS